MGRLLPMLQDGGLMYSAYFVLTRFYCEREKLDTNSMTFSMEFL